MGDCRAPYTIEAHWAALRGKPHFEGVGLRAKCFLHFLHFLPFLPFLPFLHLPVFFSLGTQPPYYAEHESSMLLLSFILSTGLAIT